MSLLSVVIPVHNEEQVIGPCLDALLAQESPVREIIVVNNRSTDGTIGALTPYGESIVVLHEERVGVQHARNQGMDFASGSLIGRIDADSRLPPDWSRRVLAAFEDAGLDAVTGPARYYDVALAPLINLGDAAIRRVWSARMDWIFGANMAIRATAWHRVRPSLCTTADIHEDLDLAIHLYASGMRIGYEPLLRAGTSARRIAGSFRDYRSYLRMTEVGYRTHGAGGSYVRGWLTNRLLMALFLPLRYLHAIRARSLEPRKNPMRPY